MIQGSSNSAQQLIRAVNIFMYNLFVLLNLSVLYSLIDKYNFFTCS